jgi:hypothetical protein
MLRCKNTKIKCRVPLVCVNMSVEGRGSSSELRHVQTIPQGHVTISPLLGFPHCVLTLRHRRVRLKGTEFMVCLSSTGKE